MRLSLTFPQKKRTTLLVNKKHLSANNSNNDTNDMANQVNLKRKAAKVDAIDLTADDEDLPTPTPKKAPKLQEPTTPVSKRTVTAAALPPTPASSQAERSLTVIAPPQTSSPNSKAVSETVTTEEVGINIGTPSGCTNQVTLTVSPPSNDAEIVETQQPQALHNASQIAERYTTTRSPDGKIYYRDPKRFCLKPAYWCRWNSRAYSLAASLLEPKIAEVATSLASELDIPLEEANHMLRFTVLNPLYDCKEARKRGEKGIQEIFDLYNKYGTEIRLWGDEKKKIRGKGELSHVSEGFVHIIAAKDGLERKVPLNLLSEEDRKYLGKTLKGVDLGKLLGKKGVVEKLDAEAEKEVLCESVKHINDMTVPQLQTVSRREVHEVEDNWGI